MIKYTWIWLLVLACFVFAISGYSQAIARNSIDTERAEAIRIANMLYPQLIEGNYARQIEDWKTFAKLSAKSIFSNADILKLKSGYILYNPMNGVTFVIVRTTKNTSTLYSFDPYQILSKTGKLSYGPTELMFELAYSRVPQAIRLLYNRARDLNAADLASYISQQFPQTNFSGVTMGDFLQGPYLRIATYGKCINQLDGEGLIRRIKADLVNSNMKDMAKNGFEYSDFLPLSSNWAVLILVAKNNGSFYAISTVQMGEHCLIDETHYKTL